MDWGFFLLLKNISTPSDVGLHLLCLSFVLQC